MTYCPECEATVDERGRCGNCGDTLGGHRAVTDGGRDPDRGTDDRQAGGDGPGDPDRSQQGGQPNQGGGDRQGQHHGGQPSQGQPQQRPRQQGQPQRQPRQQGQPGPQRGPPPEQGTGSGGIDASRRNLLIGGAVLGAVGGWFFFLRDSGPSGPEAVAYDLAAAIENEDDQETQEAIQQLTHEDAPGGETRALQEINEVVGGMSTSIAEEEMQQDVDVTFEVENAEVRRREEVDQSNVQEQALLDVEFAFRFEVAGQSVSESFPAEIVVVQNADGEWKLWQVQ